jgi:hypothetical protein
MSAAFSPIMIVGALVLPPTTVGMISVHHAQVFDPFDPQTRVVDGRWVVVRSRRKGADRMILRVGAPLPALFL